MENKAHALAAGLFTLVLGAAVILAAMWFTGDTYEKDYYVLESRYSVSGLNEQAVVRLRGVDVGKVTQIRFDPSDPGAILITIGVQKGTPVTRSTYAEVKPQGVTGLSYIFLNDTGKDTSPLPPANQPNSARIAVRQTALENLLAGGGEALADIRMVAQRVAAFLSDENRAQVASTLAAMKQATDRLAALAVAAEPAVRSIEPLAADTRKSLDRANALMADLSVASKEFSARLEAIDRVAGSAEKASGSLKTLADAAATESLPRINALVDQLTHTSRNLDRLVSDVKQQPQSLVFGRKPAKPAPGEPGFEQVPAKGATK